MENKYVLRTKLGQGWELCGTVHDTYGYVYYFKKESTEK